MEVRLLSAALTDERLFVHAESATELRNWLEANHATRDGAWLVTWKKNSGGPHLSWAEIVPELLAYGWIDSKAKRFDEDRRQLTITPRRPRSNWSKRNKEIVARLLAEKRMKPAGIAMVELAKESGTWNALDSVEALEEPEDLVAALDGNHASREHWDSFPPSAKRAILDWIGSAKREQTRARRIAETAEQAALNIRANERPPQDRD